MKTEELLERMIFISGPPRSGTTFAVKSLNHHPAFIAAIDDHVYECWGLYYYRRRCGLVHEMRTRSVKRAEAEEILVQHLFDDENLIAAAPSEKTKKFTEVPENLSRYSGRIRSVLDRDLIRYAIPLTQFSAEWRICLKSPEMTYVLPQLGDVFPNAKFVLVYRPIIEIAASMYRKGNSVMQFPVYNRRWANERDMAGQLIPPPGVPAEWSVLWNTVSDFQRCVIYAASYIRALLLGIEKINAHRYFIYNHNNLCKFPRHVFQHLAEFLSVEASGFKTAEAELKGSQSLLPSHLFEEYDKIENKLCLESLMNKIESLSLSRLKIEEVA